MKHNLSFLLLGIFCLPFSAFAGANPVPIDGGLSLLIAAGVGYGIKKVREERRNIKEKENRN